MNYWLVKSEPGVYSISDLERDTKTAWTGVRNYLARNYMRDKMQVGDMVIFYHSNADQTGIAGVAKVSSKSYSDPTQFDAASEYYDGKATHEKPIWFLVDIEFVKKLPCVIELTELKSNPKLKNMVLVQKGSRLSVQPVRQEEFEEIFK